MNRFFHNSSEYRIVAGYVSDSGFELGVFFSLFFCNHFYCVMSHGRSAGLELSTGKPAEEKRTNDLKF